MKKLLLFLIFPVLCLSLPSPKVKEALKAEGMEGKEIGMGPNNVIVTTHEGVQLFLFSLF